jgi:hypothetical protein
MVLVCEMVAADQPVAYTVRGTQIYSASGVINLTFSSSKVGSLHREISFVNLIPGVDLWSQKLWRFIICTSPFSYSRVFVSGRGL